MLNSSKKCFWVTGTAPNQEPTSTVTDQKPRTINCTNINIKEHSRHKTET